MVYLKMRNVTEKRFMEWTSISEWGNLNKTMWGRSDLKKEVLFNYQLINFFRRIQRNHEKCTSPSNYFAHEHTHFRPGGANSPLQVLIYFVFHYFDIEKKPSIYGTSIKSDKDNKSKYNYSEVLIKTYSIS